MTNENPTSTADTKALNPAAYSKAEPGAIHPARYCGNCVHLRSDVDPDQHPNGVCSRYDWDLLDENVARCSGHQTQGEKVVGLHRPAQAMDAPTAWGTSPAYLEAVADALRLEKAGDTASPAFACALCELIESAPQSYFDGLEAMQAGAAAEWKQWAADHREWQQDQQDRRDYPDFFAALADLREVIDQRGEIAAHDREHVGIFVRLFQAAPPRYRTVAEEMLAPWIPTATHCDDYGKPVFSATQIAKQLGLPVEEVEAEIKRIFDPECMYSGPIHPIQ